ncbi:aldo/keto reductase [Spirochaetia bacterium]|nr:aldo/keto reductase [Spirochaetia bacterium]
MHESAVHDNLFYMRKITLGKSDLVVPAIAVGTMRISGAAKKDAEALVKTALDEGANFFDLADCYADGECDRAFADAVGMNANLREKVILQSKCGIYRDKSVTGGKYYMLTKEHILESVDGSLKRLKTDYLDILLLHRPDALIEPAEVAEALDKLKGSGKVRYFGVSNQHPMQIQLLQKYVRQPFIVNQLQLSIVHAPMISFGLTLNTIEDTSLDRDGGVLDFCRLNDITIQTWSPFRYNVRENDKVLKGVFLDSDRYPELNTAINKIAEKYGVSNTTIALAWILRHPAQMQGVTGTTNAQRLRDCIKATEISLTYPEWYEIYLAAGNTLP